MQRPPLRPIVLSAALLFPATARAQSSGPPPTPVREVTDTYSGTPVVDPYRWLENTKDSAVVQWLRDQQAFTHRVLDAIPGRAALEARIRDLDNAGPSVVNVQFAGARYFYFKTLPGEDVRKLYVRDRLGAPERLLVDPERLRQPGGPHWAIDYYTPSWDGRYVAYGASPGGSENSILRVLDVDGGRLLPDSIDRAQFGGVAWRPDGQSFFYTRLQKLGPDSPATDKYRRSRAYLHVLGQAVATDPVLLGLGVSSGVTLNEDDFPFVATVPGSEWALAGIAHGVRNELDAYVAPLAAVRDSATAWRLLMDVRDSVTGFDLHGDDIYLLTHANAPRFKVVRTTLRAPDVAHAAIVVPESEGVVTAIGAARDALYVQSLEGGLGRLRRLPFGAGRLEPVGLPFDGAISALVTSARRAGALLALESWVHAPLWYAFDPASRRVTDTGLQPASPVDFSAVAADEVKVASYDSTLVPLSIIHRRDLVRDASHPTLLDGYGSYGITYDPVFRPTSLAWFEHGGVLAVCHVRGGGEFGEGWHQAGRERTKANTWRDFIACAEYLVREHWTSPERLGGTGTSAGGITIGMAVTERPELFRVALPRVGAVNALRAMEVGAGGPANRPEFGDPTTADGARDLLAMDAYHHIRSGTAYPAMLVTTGMNDPRVDTWEPAKFAARVQAATSSGRPVLLRVEFEGGHGFGSTKTQVEAEQADRYSFLLWQFGVRGFQPGTVP